MGYGGIIKENYGVFTFICRRATEFLVLFCVSFEFISFIYLNILISTYMDHKFLRISNMTLGLPYFTVGTLQTI